MFVEAIALFCVIALGDGVTIRVTLSGEVICAGKPADDKLVRIQLYVKIPNSKYEAVREGAVWMSNGTYEYAMYITDTAFTSIRPVVVIEEADCGACKDDRAAMHSYPSFNMRKISAEERLNGVRLDAEPFDIGHPEHCVNVSKLFEYPKMSI